MTVGFLCVFSGLLLRAADFGVTDGDDDGTSSGYVLDSGSGTLELEDPELRWIWFVHFAQPGDYAVSAKVAVAQSHAGGRLRVGDWMPQRGEASSAEAVLGATDPGADVNPEWQALGTIRIPAAGDRTLFARMVSCPGAGPGLLHAIRIEGAGAVSLATPWEARASACDPRSSGAGFALRARYTEVIPRPWPLPAIKGTFTTVQAPGGYIGCQEDQFFWSSWKSNGVAPEILVAFGGTRVFSHEGNGCTIMLDHFFLPFERRRKTLVFHKRDGNGTYLATVCVGEAGQGWHLLGRMRRPAGGTTVSTTLGFLENPGIFNGHLHRRSSAWGNPWFYGNVSGNYDWRQPAQLLAHLRGPSPTDPPPLPRAAYPWGETRLRKDMMEMTTGGQIRIAANDTYYATPSAPRPELPTLNLAYDLGSESRVHQAPDATAGQAYSASAAALVRDPFSSLDFTFSRLSGPSWLTLASDGTLGGTPGAGDAGQHLLTLVATDPYAGLSGTFTVGVYVKQGGNNPPVFLDHPASVQIAASPGGAGILALRYHDPDPGDTRTLSIVAGNTGNAFSIDQASGMLVKNATPAPETTWNLTLRVADASGASDTTALTLVSGPADPAGGASRELWTAMTGTDVADLTGDPRYPDQATRCSMLGSLEDEGPGKNTGTRVRGWIHPPASGQFRFWISAEDSAEFFLSTDDSPSNMSKICESTHPTAFRNYGRYSEQRSDLVSLVAGQRYYFEVLQKNGGTTGNFDGSFSVAWRGPGMARAPVPAGALSAWRNLTPAFRAATITLRPVVTGEAYREFLRTKLRTIFDHPGLVYSKTSGPAWLQVAPDGTLGGTPGSSDAGTNTFVLRATAAGGLHAEATFLVEVSGNQAPQFAADPLVLPEADAGTPMEVSVAGQASDANEGAHFGTGDRLTFSLVNAPAWLRIDPTGRLFGTPLAADAGLNEFGIVATDLGGLSTATTARITVRRDNHAPVFTSDPVTLAAVSGRAVSGSLADYATDPDAGDTLVFAKLSGPGWLEIAADGSLGGAPDAADYGTNSFSVEVRDSLGASGTATLEVSVQNPAPDVYEGFEGNAGTAADGFGSGVGWADGSSWSRFGGTAGSTLLGAPNSFPGLAALGRSAALSGGEDLRRALAGACTIGAAPDQFKELWLSFSLDNPGPVAVGHEYRVVLQDNGADVLAFGKEINNKWRLLAGDAFVDFTANGGSANLGNWFAVVRLAFDGADTRATAWLARDGDAGLDINDLATFPRTGSVTIPGNATFSAIAMRSHNTTSARIDEIAVASDYPRLLSLAADNDGDGSPNYLDADDDNDGIPDSWENLHACLDPFADDASADIDSDGFTNFQEYVADTAPDQRGERLRLLSLDSTPGAPARVSFQSSARRTYRVEFSADLAAGAWSPLASDISGTGGVIEIDDPGAGGLPRRFYRLAVRVP